MSRVGRLPIPIPSGVSVDTVAEGVRVKGPKGVLIEKIPQIVTMTVADGEVRFARPDDKKESRSLHGLARALVANMVRGVVTPFERRLEIRGVGYRADVSGKTLNVNVGYSNPVVVNIRQSVPLLGTTIPAHRGSHEHRFEISFHASHVYSKQHLTGLHL